MPRKNRPSGKRRRSGAASHRPLSIPTTTWTESTPRGEWTVRRLRGGEKAYVCPGCNQVIPAGVGHIVAWRSDLWIGAEGRRHWHTPCWERSAHRR